MNTDALLAGAHGLIGHELAAQWARMPAHPMNRPAAATLHLLVRPDTAAPVRKGAPSAQPQQQLHVVDFLQLPRLPAALTAFCCLGATQKSAEAQEAFRAVDHHAVLAFARAAQAAGVQRFGVVSAQGADPQARSLYHRLKGEMEAELQLLGFASLVIARPALLVGEPAVPAQASRPGPGLALALAAPLLPKAWRPIKAATVARALVKAVAQAAPGVRVLEPAELFRCGA
jgi:uncharacterized protein YbjT (DUF2867 family)